MQIYRKPFSYISGVEPVILVNSLSGFLGSLQVALEDNWSLYANLKDGLKKKANRFDTMARASLHPAAQLISLLIRFEH